jgi:hypothetical protein
MLSKPSCRGAAVLVAFASAAFAQSLTTDRAEFTVTSDVVGNRSSQIETGALMEASQGSRLWHSPCPLFRFGLGDTFEVRMGGDGLLGSSGPGGLRELGMSDFSIGFKWKLASEGRFLPAIALNPSVSTPVGGRQFSSAGYDPTLRLALAKRLIKGFRSSGNLSGSSLTDGRRFFQRAMSLCIEHDLPAHMVGYTEVYTLSSLHPHDGASTMFNTGLFRSLGTRMQVDAEIGRRLSHCGPTWFAGLGFVVRVTRPREH